MREELFAGAVAGTIQVIITCPMEIVKIRLQTQASMAKHLQTGPWQIISELGPRGLYRGAAATMMRDIPFSIIFFPGFANLRKLLADERGNNTFGSMLAAGMIAGATAAGSVTPFDVIKTRIQSGANPYGTSVIATFGGILRNEGPRALFKGALARMCIFAPLFGIVQSAFEVQKMWLEHQMKKRNNL
jgi:solute carrier family 25 aspartate/glutamate transporter 12/13